MTRHNYRALEAFPGGSALVSWPARALALLGVILGIASPTSAAAWDHICQPTEVAAIPNRIHVACKDKGVLINLPGGMLPAGAIVRYFALSTKDTAQCARVLSLAATAIASGKKLGISYNTDYNDTSGESISCDKSNCRLIRDIAILE